MNKQSLLLIMKPTLGCNAQCAYCIYADNTTKTPKMTNEQFSVIMKKIKEYSSQFQQCHVNFLWHGGEPTLMGAEFYRHVLSECQNYSPFFSSAHMLQTNLLSIGNKTFDALLSLMPDNTKISTSFDPIEDVRILKGPRTYNEQWIDNIFKLREKNITPNVVYTVHSNSLGNEETIYYFFKNLNIKAMRINPVVNYLTSEKDESQLSVDDYADFLIAMWNVWLEDKKSISIEPFTSWHDLLFNQSEGRLGCSFNGKCSYYMFSISADGSVFPCGRHMEHGFEKLGNIYDERLTEIESRKNPYAIGKESHPECSDCEWQTLCNGGCPMENDRDEATQYGKTKFCDSYKKFFSYING